MNPFLHDTVAQPSPKACASSPQPSDQSAPVPGALQPKRQPKRPWRTARQAKGRGHSGASRLTRIVSVAALAWAGAAGAVDLNTASLDQLQSIRGIGAKTAQIIVDERSRGGSYASFSDLSDRVRGIGPRRAQALQSAGLTISGNAHGSSHGAAGHKLPGKQPGPPVKP